MICWKCFYPAATSLQYLPGLPAVAGPGTYLRLIVNCFMISEKLFVVLISISSIYLIPPVDRGRQKKIFLEKINQLDNE